MKNSKIEWTHHTFNPWIGCTKVSPGCAHCYAETLMDTRWGRVKWGRGQPRVRTSTIYWRQPLAWNESAAARGVRERVFCASMADVFDEEVERDWRDDLFDLIGETPQLDWLLLTKRPQRMLELQGMTSYERVKNVWLGVSVENQKAAEERIPCLLASGAVVKFLSVEPLLEEVDLRTWSHDGIDWVIVGGESGWGARPMKEEWVHGIHEWCLQNRVAFFFKQWGGVDKHKTGRLFGGRTWDEVPIIKPAKQEGTRRMVMACRSAAR